MGGVAEREAPHHAQAANGAALGAIGGAGHSGSLTVRAHRLKWLGEGAFARSSIHARQKQVATFGLF
jgi:hypothetical protein